MLPDSPRSGRKKWAWALFLLLSPAAYFLGTLLVVKTDPSAQLGLAIDRNQAITLARQAAASQGVETEGWPGHCKIEADNDRHFYFTLRRGRELDLVRGLAPEAFIRVLLIAPNGGERFEAQLAPDGRVLGFTRRLPPDQAAPDPGEAASRGLAETALRTLAETADLSKLGAPTLSEERNSGGVTRRYAWRWPLETLSELELQLIIAVRGNAVTTSQVETKFDPNFADRNFINRRFAGKIASGIRALLIFLLALYGIYRYLQRTRQKEVSHLRSLLLSATIGGAFSLLLIQSDLFNFIQPTRPEQEEAPVWFLYLSVGFVYLIMGLFSGLAYGSGEGDLREAYPGKLTSLDALILGKVCSRNVARALIIGSAFGGWVVLINSAILLPWSRWPGGGQGLAVELLSLLFGRLPVLSTFLSPPFSAIIITVFSLLLPLPFLLRRFRSPRLTTIFLILIACLATFEMRSVPFTAGLLMAAVTAGSLLVSFFRFDLLTALVSVAAPGFVTSVMYFASQPAAAWHSVGLISGGMGLSLLAVQFFFAYQGREYREEEVRPLYARHLAERLALQAEVSAAREAQVRLLPQALPTVAGLSVAASFRPAYEVGGDFYDVFALGPEKLGIFVAEGGGRGLAAALSIAFAKGFLMPMIRTNASPAEVVGSLQSELGNVLGRDEGVGFVYAVVDSAGGTLRYARTGIYPRVLVGRRGFGSAHDPEEREAAFALDDLSRPPLAVTTATCPLAPGDSVILFTDGLAGSGVVQLLSELKPGPAGHLHERLTKAVDASFKQARKRGFEDDMTAIVVRLERAVAEAAEEVA